MAFVTEDRVLETSTTTGTGNFTLAGAVPGFRVFSAVCATNDIVPYAIELVDSSGVPTGEFETGIGTYSGANTLTRTTVLRSSNGNAAVSFSAGTKRVALSSLAEFSQWRQIGATQNTTSGTAVTFASIPQIYNDLLLEFIGVSHNSGGNASLNIELSDNGANWTGVQSLALNQGAAILMTGTALLTRPRGEAGSIIGAVANLTADRTAGPTLGSLAAWRIAAGIAHVRISISAGAFDAGSIKLHGR